jgi:crossover junction endodeoxyribonuclease RuvC
MRIIGIDPGTINSGFGIIDCQGTNITHVTSGTIRAPKKDMPQRLSHIFSEIEALFIEYKPDVMSIEDVFMYKNAKSALKLGQARGVALLAAARSNVPVHTYAPKLIKKTVAGFGGAEKQQVEMMVSMMLNIKNFPTNDASDALAIAICHLHHADFAC